MNQQQTKAQAERVRRNREREAVDTVVDTWDGEDEETRLTIRWGAQRDSIKTIWPELTEALDALSRLRSGE